MTVSRKALLPIGALILLWSASIQWSSRSVGLFYDDFLVFGHYSALTVLRAWWTDLAVLTSPELWVHVYQPLTLAVHALTYEVFGFHPGPLLVARVLMGGGIAICLYVWLRTLGAAKDVAVLGALLFLVFPANYYAFTWNTEIAAISTLIWFLLALIQATRYLEHPSRRRLVLSCLFWTFALLTKEVVVPLVAVFPILWLFYGDRTRWRDCLSFSSSFVLLTAIYVAVRFIVLEGAWGAQGLTPDSGISIVAYARNFVIFLAWVGYAIPMWLAAGERLASLRLDALALIGPLACAGIELVRSIRGPWIGGIVAAARRLAPVQKQLWLGVAVTLTGGLICCFLPIPRIMFAAALGPVLLISALPEILRRSGGIRPPAVVLLCVVVLAVNGLWYFDLVHGRLSDFTRRKNLKYVESYFRFGHLFEQWELRGQADYLREQLVGAGLIDPATGRLRSAALGEHLTSIGMPEGQADDIVRQMERYRGAFQQ